MEAVQDHTITRGPGAHRDNLTYAPYDAPPVHVGAKVFFYANCDRRNQILGEVVKAPWVRDPEAPPRSEAAMIPPRTISLLIYQETGTSRVDSVMHAGDPWTQHPQKRAIGCWDFRPPDPEIAKLNNTVDHLVNWVQQLEDVLTSTQQGKKELANIRRKATLERKERERKERGRGEEEQPSPEALRRELEGEPSTTAVEHAEDDAHDIGRE